MTRLHHILVLLVAMALGLSGGAANLETPKGTVQIPESEFDGTSWVCGAEVAKALGGTFGTDSTYRRPVMQVLGHRILLSEETAVFSMDGKILRLSRPPQNKDNCLWLPRDFLDSLGLKSAPPPAAGKSAADSRPPVEISTDPEGTRITLQGKGILEAKVKEEGRGVELVLAAGNFGGVPKLAQGSGFEKAELSNGGRSLRILWAPGAGGEVLRLRNPDRVVIALHKQPPAALPPQGEPAVNAAPSPPPSNAPPPVAAAAPAVPQNGPGIDFVVLDPGHGGSEVGAEGSGGILEKDLTLAICRRTQVALEKAGFKAILTRTTDVTLPLQSRTAFANSHQADLFICLHVNSSPSSKAHGTETYYHSTEATDLWAKGLADRENAVPQAAPAERDGVSLVLWDLAQTSYIKMSATLAELLQRQFNELLSTRDRGVRQAPFAVLQGAQMPAVLLEVAFLSNAAEAKKLGEADFQDQVAESIAEAVKAFKAASEAPPANSAGPEKP